jgi:hypothetical protein
MKKLLLICGIFIILLLSMPLSCNRMKAKEGVETDSNGQSASKSPVYDNNDFNPPSNQNYAIIGGYNTRHTLSQASTQTFLLISIEKDEHADLTGIEQYKNLEKLMIYLNETSDVDFSPLKSLPKLENIDILGRTLTKLPDLSGIPSLTVLFLNYTSLTSLNGLEKIPQLEFLIINDGFKPITDTSALRYLKKLKKLYIYSGSYTINFNDLKDLSELEEIYLADCEELDLSGIGQLSKLKKLELMTNVSEKTGKRGVIKNIEEIGRIKGLNELLLDDLLTSVEFLANNTELEYLELVSGKDRDDYYDTRLPLDIAPLGKLKKLKRLTIRGFELKNKQVIDKLPELEVFNNALFDLE